MNVYIAHINGYFIGGTFIVIDETKRKAYNQAKKKLKELNLLDKNHDFTMQDIEEVETDKRHLIVISDGNY